MENRNCTRENWVLGSIVRIRFDIKDIIFGQIKRSCERCFRIIPGIGLLIYVLNVFDLSNYLVIAKVFLCCWWVVLVWQSARITLWKVCSHSGRRMCDMGMKSLFVVLLYCGDCLANKFAPVLLKVYEYEYNSSGDCCGYCEIYIFYCPSQHRLAM